MSQLLQHTLLRCQRMALNCSTPLRQAVGMCVLSFARAMNFLALGTLLYFFPGPVIAMIYSIEGDHESSEGSQMLSQWC